MESDHLSGIRLGLDIGKVRIGVAISDPQGILASPLSTVQRDATSADLIELVRIVQHNNVIEVVVGLPLTLRGDEGKTAAQIRRYAAKLAQRIAPIPVVLADERLTTVIATRALAGQGVRGKKQRAVVDQVAAVEILQSWLDRHRAIRPDRPGNAGEVAL